MRESGILVWACKKIANHLEEHENANFLQLTALAKRAKESEKKREAAQRILVGKWPDGKK